MIKVIEVAVVWNDPRLFETIWAYAERVPDLRVRDTSVAALLAGAEPRPDVVLIEVARRDQFDPVAAVRKLCRAGHRVLALSASTDPYLSAALLGTGACLLPGRNQTVTAIIAAIRASGPGRVRRVRRIAGGVTAGSGMRAAVTRLANGVPVNGTPANGIPAANGTRGTLRGAPGTNGTAMAGAPGGNGAAGGGVSPRAPAGPSGAPLRPRLSQRERSVLIAYTSGLTLDAVARRVGIRPSTAKTYLERVKAKYREIGRPAYTKLELAQRADEDGC